MPSRTLACTNMQNKTPTKESSSNDSSASEGESEDLSVESDTSPKGPKKVIKNPYFKEKDSSDVSSDSDSEFDSGSDSEDVHEQDENKNDGPDDEDPLIKALKAAKERKYIKERNAPPDLRFSNEVMDITFHPESSLLGVSLIDGQIDIFGYSNDENVLKKRLKIHKFSVRTLEFDVSGNRLFSGSGAPGDTGTIKLTDVETSQVIFKALKCHASPLYKVKPMTEHLFASGDEDGTVKLWDSRQ